MTELWLLIVSSTLTVISPQNAYHVFEDESKLEEFAKDFGDKYKSANPAFQKHLIDVKNSKLEDFEYKLQKVAK